MQGQITPEFETLTVRVDKRVAERMKEIAAAEYRPLAAELRRMIEERVAVEDAA